jgi:probable F420-dependent oxidoreductase
MSEAAMKFGIDIGPTEASLDVRRLGQLVEEFGFESLFFPEHTHVPAIPGSAPRQRTHMLDPFIALTAVAAVTERLLVATGVCLIIQRDPIITAKEVATLDLLSDGRFLFDIGAGWHRQEMRNHGTAPRIRFALMRERVLAMQALWTAEDSEFHGEYVDFDPIWLWPKPVQRPHPPILIGGEGPTVLERVLEYGGGWMPNAHPEVEQRTRELHRKSAELGLPAPEVTVIHTAADVAVVRGYAEAGIGRCLFSLPSAGEEQIVALLDQFRRVVDEFDASA